MIGIYDYTVILTYLSAISGIIGTFVILGGVENLAAGIMFLMFCGLCDLFDGAIAKTKKNRTEFHKMFGIQIDTLADFVAFGMLPSSISYSLLKNSSFSSIVRIIFLAMIIFYFLSVLIRLAYYNTNEILKQSQDSDSKRYYIGLTAPTIAYLFPMIYIIQNITSINISIVYFISMPVMSIAYLSKIKIPKPKLKGMIIMVVAGFTEIILMLITM